MQYNFEALCLSELFFISNERATQIVRELADVISYICGNIESYKYKDVDGETGISFGKCAKKFMENFSDVQEIGFISVMLPKLMEVIVDKIEEAKLQMEVLEFLSKR